jgi:hypothetical protein
MHSLLTTLEAILGRNLPPSRLLLLLGKVMGTLGIILIAVAAAIYLQFVGAQYNYIRTPAVITQVTNLLPDTTLQAVEFEYNLAGNVFQKSETSRGFRELKYARGDTLHLLVDPENYENFLYAEAGLFYKDFALNWSTAGLLALVVGGFIMARARRIARQKGLS